MRSQKVGVAMLLPAAMSKLAALAGVLIALAAGPLRAGEGPGDKTILNHMTFWRQHYTLDGPVMRQGAELQKIKLISHGKEVAKWLGFETALPRAGWQKAEFDDSGWLRKPVCEPKSPWLKLLCLRGRFHVADPQKAAGLALSLRYRGGLAVYLNGQEIARGHLKPGAAPTDLAEDYAAADFMELRDLTAIPLPKNHLRKGVNVLAIEVHRSAQHGSAVTMVDKSIAFDAGTCGIAEVRLWAAPGDEVAPNVTRPAGLQVWNSHLLVTDFEADYGDPNEPLGPVRILAPRGGAGSGKVVVGSKSVIRALTATASDLAAKGGSARIAASAIQVRYAQPASYGWEGDYGLRGMSPFCFDALHETAPEEVKVGDARVGNPTERRALSGAVAPIWITVEVPPDAPPGDYSGNLAVNVAGQQIATAPIELRVCRWKAPAPKDYVTFVDMIQSPESVAMEYEVPLWSDEHFKFLAKSLSLLGQVGNKVCYVPLICDTNMGNDESMVRWIKQPDGSYKHDYSVMEKYLDAVERHQGKPMVVCFQVWDAYLEGGLSEGRVHQNIPEKVEADRRAHAGEGPIVSLLDPATEKIEKHFLPLQSAPQSVALWGPVIGEIRERMRKRGLGSAMMLGIMTDQYPTKAAAQFFNTVAPGIPWTRSAHDEYRKTVAGLPLGYMSEPYASKRLFALDPSESRGHGWRGEALEVHFPRNIYNPFPMSAWRFMGEMNAAGELRGFARLGGDFFGIKNAKGRRGATLAARFPKSGWRMLDIQTALLAPGKSGAVPTARFEVLREGLQECEARIAIDKALVNADKKAKLGPEVAEKAQDLLDQRVRDMRRAVSTLRARLEGTYKWPASAYGDAWYMFAPVLGNFWYVSSGWERETERLYDMAAEVEAKLVQP
jgi:hypothetical protein